MSKRKDAIQREYGIQPDGRKGIQPIDSLDTTNPPAGGSGVRPRPSSNESPSNQSSSGNENNQK